MIAEWIAGDADAAILDFGCGPGSLLAYLRDKCGFTNLTGIELNKSSVAVASQAYGLTILSEPSSLEGRRFDVVVLIEVIEHVSDVDEIMQAVDRLLRPGGQLVVTTDAVNNPVASHFPAWSPHFTGPSHISLFSSDALGRLLTRFGYDIEKAKLAYSHELLGDILASPFYSLDFSSPASTDDLNDRLFVPTALGRRLGLRPTRSLPRPLRAIRRVDSLAARAIERFGGRRFPSHQFVLARKKAT
ncbi:class I SAM-dependent methyltransferase [Ensifer sp. MPMI2T]|nr:class I SAM-dependent methyltransferase [Ensifer sp. MPMI2T]